jgi:F0F1-type ATP synthase membrane subunit b/b'
MREWLHKQVDAAKMAWSIILILGSLFGYKITVTPTSQSLEQRLTEISKQLDKIENNLELQKPATR